MIIITQSFGFSDPLRPDAADSVQRCMRMGVRVIMVTGDHAATATYVASQIGITAPGRAPADSIAHPSVVMVIWMLLCSCFVHTCAHACVMWLFAQVTMPTATYDA